MAEYIQWLKALHIIFVITWMAGMFYLPRLFVYHTEVRLGSEEDKRFQIMEEKLLRIIINPSMILAMIFGLLVAKIYGFKNLGMWFHLKMGLFLVMLMLHMFFSICRKKFLRGENTHSKFFYKVINEVPVIIMILIVLLVVIKPFE